jgi:predicted Holliday junction resolvase-like endonuclease
MIYKILFIIAYFSLLIYAYFLNKKNKELNAILSDLATQLVTKSLEVKEVKERLFDQFEENQNKLSDSLEEVYSLENQITTLKVSHKNELIKARKDALDKSRSVMRGQATEHLAPFIIEGTNPKDYRFMGNPVDYVLFEGLSDLIDKKSDEIVSIKFIDIKTGKSSLNKSQRRIRDAIKDNKVTFEVINLDEVLNDNKVEERAQIKSPQESKD